MNAKVSIARAENPYDLMEKSLDMINLGEKLKKESKVLIKPNLVRTPCKSGWAKREGAYELTYAPEGDIVHRESIEALINILVENGVEPKNVTVGEAPGGCEAETVFKALGLHELCEGFGAQLVDLNMAPAKKIPVKDGWLLLDLWVPVAVLQADVRINLTTLKAHGGTIVSLCLKNWGMGIPPGRYYGISKDGRGHRKGTAGSLPIHPRGIWGKEPEKGLLSLGQEIAVSKVIVDVCKAVGYDIGILEGLAIADYPETNQSLRSFRMRRNNLMLASFDMVAIDAVGARILGFDHNKILHIKWAGERGLGITDLNKMDIVGEKISEVEIRCNPFLSQIETMLPPSEKMNTE